MEPTPSLSLEELLAMDRAATKHETVQEQILASLQTDAAKAGKEARMEILPYGRNVFHFGEDVAWFQGHSENGVMRNYTPMLDLQKEWWRKAFLHEQYGGNLDAIGLISPPVADVFALYAPSAAQSFTLKALVFASGKKADALDDELIDNAIFGGKQLEALAVKATDIIARFYRTLTLPAFDVQFNDGNGDLVHRLRLVPQTQEAQLALINGGKLIESLVENIIGNRSNLVAFLRSELS